MNHRLDQRARERERLIAAIDEQRRQVERNFTALRGPLGGVDRVRQTTRYIRNHRFTIWAALMLFSLLRRKRSGRGRVPARPTGNFSALGRKGPFR